MARSPQIDIEQLKSRGLSCAKLKAMESRQRKDSSEFRKAGFNNIAQTEDQVANKIKGLRKQVCLLK